MLIFKMGQGGYCILFCLSRRPKIPLWQTAAYRQCDYPGRMTKNRWHFLDAHFQDGAGRVVQSVLPTMEAKNCFMTDYNLSAVWLPREQDRKSLTLCWHSFSWWGREGIAICWAYKGGQKFFYDWLQCIGSVITPDAWPKIVDTPLMLILKMR